MAARVTYTTADGTVFDLSRGNVTAATLDLLGWEWTPSGRTMALGPRESEMELALWGSEGRAKANDLLRRVDADNAAGRAGMLDIDGWVLVCSLYRGERTKWTPGASVWTIGIYAPDPTWRRRTNYVLVPRNSSTSGDGSDLPLDLPCDLSLDVTSGASVEFDVASVARLGFRFYGPATAPYVTVTVQTAVSVTHQTYGVEASCSEGEVIIIDPYGRDELGGSVYRMTAYGSRANLYHARTGRDACFAPVEPGHITVTVYGVAKADITVTEERVAFPWPE